MEKEDILNSDLKHKERSIQDLIRYISTRTGNIPNYTLLLGAGCSVSSEIKSATALIHQWYEDIFRTQFKDEDFTLEKAKEKFSSQSWYNKSKEYSSLFQKRYDLPSQRRNFIESEVSNKIPSIGYSFLIRLIQENFFNTVFTTNFDDLLNEAFHLYEHSTSVNDMLRPIICAHDSSINSISITSPRPKIIKLHGDYLFDDLKSTVRETESLQENMKNKLVEFCKEFGMIVVGYSGNDKSIMDVLDILLKTDSYLKHGLYWCVRRGDTISEDLKRLLWKDRVYFVRIDGFDELFAELYHGILKLDEPPIPDLISGKNEIVIESIKKNVTLNSTQNHCLKMYLEQFQNEIQKKSFNERLQKIFGNLGDKFTESEGFRLLEIQKLISQKRSDEALNSIENELYKEKSKQYKINLLQAKASVLKEKGEYSDAKSVCNDIIKQSNYELGSFFFKNNILKTNKERLENLEEAKEKHNTSYRFYEQLSSVLYELYEETMDANERKQYKDDLIQSLNEGIVHNPFYKNKCYLKKITFLATEKENATHKWKEECEEIIQKAKEQNCEDPLTYSYHCIYMEAKNEDLTPLHQELQKKDNIRKYIDILLDLSLSNVSSSCINYMLSRIDNIKEWREFPTLTQRKLAKFYMNKAKDLKKAQEILLSLDNEEICYTDLEDLYEISSFLGNYSEIKDRIEAKVKYLNEEEKLIYDIYLCDKSNDIIKRDDIVKTLSEKTNKNKNFLNSEIYILLQKKEYRAAYDKCQEYMQKFTSDRGDVFKINYQIARKNLNKRVDTDMLEGMIKEHNDAFIQVACCILLDRKEDAIKIMSEEIKKNFGSLFNFMNQEIFLMTDYIQNYLRNQMEEFKAMIKS